MLEPKTLYHIYNQGNNKELVFREDQDYLRFLEKVNSLVKPNCEILTYCLMPNHFHFIVLTTNKSVRPIQVGNIELTELTNSFRKLLSEFAKEINKKYIRSGSLFRQKTKYDLVDNGDVKYPLNLLRYVLINPLEANLVDDLNDWKYSSYLDFVGLRNGKLCNKTLAKDIFQIKLEQLTELNSFDRGEAFFKTHL